MIRDLPQSYGVPPRLAVMTPHRHRMGRLRTVRSSLALGGVGVLAGLLFATNAGIFAEATDRQPQDLRDLVRDENERMQEVGEEVGELRAQVEELVTLRETQGSDEAPDPADTAVEQAAGRVALEGPGVRVELWDAPFTEVPEGYSADDLVVHQQDIEAVLNGLRSGGAEAIAVQGHRITSTTAVRCVGNVLLLDGNTYSPPYVITAIGDPETLSESLLDSESVRVYLQYVEAVGLGWSLEESEQLEIDGFEGNLALAYARVPGHAPFEEFTDGDEDES